MATGLTGAQQPLVGTTLQAAIPEAILTVYSNEILMEALPNLRWFQFAVTRQELGAQKGDTIEMLRYAPLDHQGKLTEGQDMQTKTMSATPVNITVDEYGNAVQVTERLLRTSPWEQLGIAAHLLADDYAITIDEYARRAAMSVPSTYFSNGKANRAALVSGDGLTTDTVKKLVELAKVQKIPPIRVPNPTTGGVSPLYILMGTPGALRTLRDESEWINAHLQNHAFNIFLGESGVYEKVIFIETTVLPVIRPTSAGALAGHVFVDDKDLSDAAVWPNDTLPVDGTPHPTLDVHQCFFMGDYLYGYAEALPVEMRDNGVEDFGRKRSLAHYSMYGFGLLNPSHGIVVELVVD